MRHDIYDCTAMPIFWNNTIFMIAPRCPSFEATRYLWVRRDTYLLKQHDIYDCTVMPIFEATRYFISSTNSFWTQNVTPRCLAPPFPARCLKIMRRWRRQDQRDVKTIARIYHAFILDCQYSFHFFPTLLFALSSFGFITNFYSLPIFLSFIFLSSCFLNGGKVSDLHSVPRSQHFSVLDSHHIFSSLRVASSFGTSRYFWLHT